MLWFGGGRLSLLSLFPVYRVFFVVVVFLFLFIYSVHDGQLAELSTENNPVKVRKTVPSTVYQETLSKQSSSDESAHVKIGILIF